MCLFLYLDFTMFQAVSLGITRPGVPKSLLTNATILDPEPIAARPAGNIGKDSEVRNLCLKMPKQFIWQNSTTGFFQ